MQQHHILVAGVLLDVAIQLADGHAPAFDGLQKNAAAITKHTGDPHSGLCWRDCMQDRLDGIGLVSTARLA